LPEALRQHDLRHRRVTKWLAEGRSAALVREARGHADLATTMNYSHLAREHLTGLVDTPTKVDVPANGANVPADVPRSA
jgi:site-specific recombinase XerD